ncbi:MAG: DUF1028 domain-containing protein [Acidimicrobiales bacterium]
MTFSLAGRCARTGRLGVAISSSSVAVASRCAFARAGAGAACSQNVTDPRLGPALLDALAGGAPGRQAVDSVAAAAPGAHWRQLTAIGPAGPAGAHSGARTLGTHGVAFGEDVVVAGNLLSSPRVVEAGRDAFGTDTSVPLARRLLAGLAAALDAGGEEGPVHSAGLLVVDRVPWPVVDLRVDWSEGDPIAEVASLYGRWAPQEEAYVLRALDPDRAPGYGVPGDDR